MNKISFFLMGQKGYEVLKYMVTHHREAIDIVIASEDKSIQKDFYKDIKNLCIKEEIQFFNRREKYIIKTDYAFAVAWRWLLYLEDVELIIFHDSLLPKYRGFNPLVSCLLNKESEVGVSALFASEKFDCGNVIGQTSVSVGYPITLQQAIDQVCKCYVTLVRDIVAKILSGEKILGQPQDEEEVTYSLWRDKEDYRIDWSKDSDYIERFVNALGFPYNGASSLMNGRLVRVLGVEQLSDIEIENRGIGKVIFKQDGKPVVVCGEGLVKINHLVENDTKESILPLRRFRTRFK